MTWCPSPASPPSPCRWRAWLFRHRLAWSSAIDHSLFAQTAWHRACCAPAGRHAAGQLRGRPRLPGARHRRPLPGRTGAADRAPPNARGPGLGAAYRPVGGLCSKDDTTLNQLQTRAAQASPDLRTAARVSRAKPACAASPSRRSAEADAPRRHWRGPPATERISSASAGTRAWPTPWRRGLPPGTDIGAQCVPSRHARAASTHPTRTGPRRGRVRRSISPPMPMVGNAAALLDEGAAGRRQ